MAKSVAFCIAVNKQQDPKWWLSLSGAMIAAVEDPNIDYHSIITSGAALPDFNKNSAVDLLVGQAGAGRRDLTDANRNEVVEEVMSLDVDYLYWWDDDTAHPPGTLQQMLALEVDFVSGLYYTKVPPYLPIAYIRNEGGTYRTLNRFTKGELVSVDATGMGCSLIHKSVYENIHANYDVYMTPDRVSWPVFRPAGFDLSKKHLPPHPSIHVNTKDGAIHYTVPAEKMTDETLARTATTWPYYGLNVMRTEDFWFCELAARLGVKPLVDTSINCKHWGQKAFEREDFKRYVLEYKEAGEEPEDGQED